MNKWRIVRGAFRVWRSYYAQLWQTIDEYDYTQASRILFSSSDINAFPVTYTENPTILGYLTGQSLPQAVNFDHLSDAMPIIISRHPLRFNLLAAIWDIEIGEISGAS